MDPATVEAYKTIWQGGTPIIFLIAIVTLWRQNNKIQDEATARYIALLDRYHTALNEIKTVLMESHEEK